MFTVSSLSIYRLFCLLVQAEENKLQPTRPPNDELLEPHDIYWSEDWPEVQVNGSDPGEVSHVFHLFCTLVSLCLTPSPAPHPHPFVCTRTRTQICAHINDPISICRKSVGLTSLSLTPEYGMWLPKRRGFFWV